MNKDQLNEVLRLHAMWLEDSDTGERADLSGAKLSGAKLSGAILSGALLSVANLLHADLHRANLSHATLSYADLRRANLRYADLREAELSGANLSGANLSCASLSGATGFLLLPVQDFRGYSWPHAVLHDHWMIRAGCRFFTIEEARQHWGDSYQGDREIGDMYLHAVDWLEEKIKVEAK